jgi:hypothetical protein
LTGGVFWIGFGHVFSSIIDAIPLKRLSPTIKTYPIDYNIVYKGMVTLRFYDNYFRFVSSFKSK